MCPLNELELVMPPTTEGADPVTSKGNNTHKLEDGYVSPYFVECANQTKLMLRKHGWDVKEAEMIIKWAKELLDLH
ncbi:unnamed protein product [Phytomonas sp. EM1]|nr:unnamed protein product [Phytomonas sp. EM1]|eukprot:CCW62067.1 unnamed protein product [Phytomonas sp. isolate EM1]